MPRSTANSTAPGDIPAAPKLTRRDRDELTALLDEMEAAFTRHIIFADPDHAPKVLALYAMLDYCRDDDDRFYFPFWLYIYLRSKGTAHGKTRIMRIMQGLTVNNSGIMINPNEPQLIRIISACRMLLWDEVLNCIGATWAQVHTILTTGNERGGRAPRVDAATGEVTWYETFCPKVFAGRNGKREMEDDVLRRSYVIDAVRVARPRLTGLVRWNPDAFEDAAAPIRARATTWASRPGVRKVLAYLGKHCNEVTVPDELEEERAESWSPLIAVAGLAGGEWSKRVAEILKAESPDEDEPQAPQSDTFDNDLRAILSRPSPLFRLGAYPAKTREQENPDVILRGTGLTCSNFGWCGKGKAPLIGSVEHRNDGKLFLRVSKTKDRPDWNRLVQMVNKVRTPGASEYNPAQVLRDYRTAGLLRTDNDQALKLTERVWARDPKQDSTVVIDISSWIVPVPYQRDIPADDNVPEAFKGMEEYDEDE